MSATMRIIMEDSNGKEINQDFSVANILDENIASFATDYQKLTANTITGAAKRPDFQDVDID